MNYEDYYNRTKQAADLVEQGEHLAAIDVLQSLLETDISDLDKAIQCLNIAVACDKMGYTDQALAWYDEGIKFEEPYSRNFLMEHKAAYLAQIKRDAESIALYEKIYKLPYSLEQDKERIWKNLTILRNPRPG